MLLMLLSHVYLPCIFFIHSSPDYLFSIYPVLPILLFSLHTVTAGIDQTSLSEMMMRIINTTAALIAQPLLWSLPLFLLTTSNISITCHTAPSAFILCRKCIPRCRQNENVCNPTPPPWNAIVSEDYFSHCKSSVYF